MAFRRRRAGRAVYGRKPRSFKRFFRGLRKKVRYSQKFKRGGFLR